jgi:hypothetical protein
VYDNYGDVLQGNFYASDGQTWTQNQDGVMTVSFNYNLNRNYYTGYHVDAIYNTDSLATGLSNLPNPDVTAFICTPNPTTGPATIKLWTDTRMEINLSLYGISGRKLQTVYSGNLTTGQHRFALDLNRFPQGIYVATLVSGNHAQSLKIIKTK